MIFWSSNYEKIHSAAEMKVDFSSKKKMYILFFIIIILLSKQAFFNAVKLQLKRVSYFDSDNFLIKKKFNN